MSFNRANVTWQSKNGLWSIGFFECYPINEGEGHDPEWDVEYNYSKFEWVSTGHATEEKADKAWQGANPGGGTIYEFLPSDEATANKYDDMAKACLAGLKEYKKSRAYRSV